jgi:hypothetical protein
MPRPPVILDLGTYGHREPQMTALGRIQPHILAE